MGNYCTRGVGGLKECVKHDLTALLCNVIVEDSKGYTTDFTVPQVRLQSIFQDNTVTTFRFRGECLKY